MSIGLISLGFFLSSCVNAPQDGQQGFVLSATEFAKQVKEKAEAVIVDVRTPEEFAEGHLEKALNVDWNGADFENQSAALDREKPIFVYCLSGARSAEAAAYLRNKGFKTVYEMDGGILRWRAANLPETGTAPKATGMSMEEYQAKVLQSDKIVLVDFYADWCAPCKKMEPYLKEIEREMAAKVVLLRINADDNPELCQALGVDALPTLKVYKKGQQTWSNVGYIDKPNVLKQL